jgi:hypothetical protein
MTAMPEKVVELYRMVQVDEDMDCGSYIGGTDVYHVRGVIEEVAKLAGWELPPRMTLAEREQYLRDQGREYDIELLGVMGD